MVIPPGAGRVTALVIVSVYAAMSEAVMVTHAAGYLEQRMSLDAGCKTGILSHRHFLR